MSGGKIAGHGRGAVVVGTVPVVLNNDKLPACVPVTPPSHSG